MTLFHFLSVKRKWNFFIFWDSLCNCLLLMPPDRIKESRIRFVYQRLSEYPFKHRGHCIVVVFCLQYFTFSQKSWTGILPQNTNHWSGTISQLKTPKSVLYSGHVLNGSFVHRKSHRPHPVPLHWSPGIVSLPQSQLYLVCHWHYLHLLTLGTPLNYHDAVIHNYTFNMRIVFSLWAIFKYHLNVLWSYLNRYSPNRLESKRETNGIES